MVSTEFLGSGGVDPLWDLHWGAVASSYASLICFLFFFFCQLEGRTVDTLLSLLWGWIPVSLRLLRLLRWGWWPGSC